MCWNTVYISVFWNVNNCWFPKKLNGSVYWFICFLDCFKQGINVSRFIIVGYTWHMLGRWDIFHTLTPLFPKTSVLNRDKGNAKTFFKFSTTENNYDFMTDKRRPNIYKKDNFKSEIKQRIANFSKLNFINKRQAIKRF